MAMAKIILVTGGCRSGKSAYAQRLAEQLSTSRLYVATCPVIDDEMRQRVEAHQRARQDRGWETIEEQLDLSGVLEGNGRFNVVLVDCLTLWINNLMYDASQSAGSGHQTESGRERAGVRGCEKDSAPSLSQDALTPCPSPVERERGEVPLPLTESDIARRCAAMLESASGRTGTVIFVSNEVGMGIVPENADARRFRDLAGRANQVIAAEADQVTLMVSGIAWHLKGSAS
jgi:adenosylcobinamide kinase/adenosylcobinamide-phosphate guanylyltransferase